MNAVEGRSPWLTGLVSGLDQLADSFLITDREGRILHVNPQFVRVTGYELNEVLGKTPSLLKSGAHPQEVYEELWRNLLEGKPFRFIFTNRKKNGDLYEEGVLISPLRDASGAISHFLSLGRVIDQFRQTYDVYTLLANSAPVAMYVLQEDKFFFVNNEFQRVTGFSAEDLIGREHGLVILDEDRDLVHAGFETAKAGGVPTPLEIRFLDATGAVRWILLTIRSAQFRGLKAIAGTFMACSFVDITDRRQTENRLKEALSLYSATIESTADGILVTDLSGETVAHNSRFLEMWSAGRFDEGKWRSADLFPVMLDQLSDPESLKALINQVVQQKADSGIAGKLRLKDGRTLEVYSQARMLEGSANGRVWSYRDITEREQIESTLSDLASFDNLTGLPNRRRFREEVELSIGRQESGAVLFIDVDDFKAINDSLGHPAGDEFLRGLADCFSRSVRQSDFLARIGGDEFAVLLRNSTRSEALSIARRLLIAAQTLRVSSLEAPTSSTLSIGAALFPEHGSNVDQLLGHADMAMYWVKQRGRNGVHFFQPRHGFKSSSTSRVLWKQRILDAIATDSFTLHAQPIFRLRPRQIVGYELLLRLRQASGALIPPKKFLSVAEGSGLINEIDSWVVCQALKVARHLSEINPELDLSFNLSAHALSNRELLDLIRGEVTSLGFDVSNIWVEITETAAISDFRQAKLFLNNLKSMGFRIALDDFGAGFSSFSRLKNVPVDFIKIDGSFVKEVTRSREDRHFVKAIAEVATGLGIDAVAEFVEEEETVDLLEEFGIQFGQGFYLARPLPVNQALRAAA